jgi:hypothetical protein
MRIEAAAHRVAGVGHLRRLLLLLAAAAALLLLLLLLLAAEGRAARRLRVRRCALSAHWVGDALADTVGPDVALRRASPPCGSRGCAHVVPERWGGNVPVS